MTELEKSIIRTIAYFDLLDYPLTSVEVWRWLYDPPLDNGLAPSLHRVHEVLKMSEALGSRLEHKQGFYCVRGRSSIVHGRKIRNLNADAQLRKAVHFAKLFRLVPWVRMVAICSSLASGNVKDTSDIDLFIVTRRNKIWQTRFLLVLLLKLLRQRPTLTATKDKICLSYYVTENALDLSHTQEAPHDVVFTYYVDGFLPIYDPDGLALRMRDENRWVYQHLPNSDWPNTTTLAVSTPRWLTILQSMFSFILMIIFNRFTLDFFINLQLRIMPHNLKSQANVSSHVIVTDNVLKFHDKDNRIFMKQRWFSRIDEIS